MVFYESVAILIVQRPASALTSLTITRALVRSTGSVRQLAAEIVLRLLSARRQSVSDRSVPRSSAPSDGTSSVSQRACSAIKVPPCSSANMFDQIESSWTQHSVSAIHVSRIGRVPGVVMLDWDGRGVGPCVAVRAFLLVLILAPHARALGPDAVEDCYKFFESQTLSIGAASPKNLLELHVRSNTKVSVSLL